MVNGIILASGFSRRFGADKLMASLSEKHVLEYTIETTLKSELETVNVVYRTPDVGVLIDQFKGVNSVLNKNAVKGQSEAIKVGLSKIDNGGAFLFLVGDQPFISVETINKLIRVFEEKKPDIVVSLYKGKKGNPVLFANHLKKELNLLTGDQGGRQLIRSEQWKIAYIEIDDENEGLDIDRPEDLETMRQLMKDKS